MTLYICIFLLLFQIIPFILSTEPMKMGSYKEFSEHAKRRQDILASKDEDSDSVSGSSAEEEETTRLKKLIRDRVMDIIKEMLELKVI